jgi:hypothetical protein
MEPENKMMTRFQRLEAVFQLPHFPACGFSVILTLAICGCGLPEWSNFAEAQENGKPVHLDCVISLNSGSLLHVEMPDQWLRWTNLASSAKGVQEQQIRLSEARQIVFSKQAGEQQLMRVRQYLFDLKDESSTYESREIAEKELSQPELGARYRFIIEADSNHPVLEVRHRIQRILNALNKVETTNIGPLDRIQLKDRTWLSGDVGNQHFEFSFRGGLLRLDRNQIESISTESYSGSAPLPRGVVANRTEVMQRFDRERWGKDHRFIDFELSPTGEPLVSRTDVSNLYLPLGLLMRSEKPGYIGISGYAFRMDCPPKENSICVFESVGNAFGRFKGIMEFRFCEPHQSGALAGVQEFGLFATRVDNARDFILEGYNSEGHLLGTVEASDANCVFMGIRSSEPMVRLRLLSNPYLFSLKRKVDEDYCVDDVYFSAPQVLPHLTAIQDANIVTTNGEILVGPWRIADDIVSLRLRETGQQIELPLTEVRSLNFGNATELVGKGKRIWYAMLEDRTILEVNPQAGFQSEWFENRKIDPSQLVGLWLAPNGLRFPLAGDFNDQDGPTSCVMVFPTARLVSRDLKLSNSGYAWQKSEMLQQDLWVLTGESGKQAAEDPTPDILAVDFSSTSPEQIPTLWLQKPPDQSSDLGFILLTSGQQVVLNGTLGIKLGHIGDDSVVVQWGAQSQEIPFPSISKIVLPITKSR